MSEDIVTLLSDEELAELILTQDGEKSLAGVVVVTPDGVRYVELLCSTLITDTRYVLRRAVENYPVVGRRYYSNDPVALVLAHSLHRQVLLPPTLAYVEAKLPAHWANNIRAQLLLAIEQHG